MYVMNNTFNLPADLANDLATAVAKRNHERICSQGFMLACAVNKIELTEALAAPYFEAFNKATKKVYSLLWDAYKINKGGHPGKTPVMKYSAKVRCDTRCTHATGSECTCTCGGINHATFYPGQFAHCADPAAQVKRIREQNAAELKELNSDPVRRLLHLFGVRKHQEVTRDFAKR